MHKEAMSNNTNADAASRVIKPSLDVSRDLPASTFMLPLRASIGGKAQAVGAHIPAMRECWGIETYQAETNLADMGRFDLPHGWRCDGSALRDAHGVERALISRSGGSSIHGWNVSGYPVMDILPRFYAGIQYDEFDRGRVAAIDRQEKRAIRSTEWSVSLSSGQLAEALREYQEWLLEIRPQCRDPWAYWS